MPVSDETVVETDGISVSKFFNAEDFPVPAVAFEVASEREGEVTLTIVDEIPDEFGIDQIGFHPEYGSEHWTATGDGVVRFEREIDAGEEFTTVYGVRMEDGQDETPFLSAPTVEVDGEDIDEVVPPESTDVVRELAGGERDTVPGLEDDEEPTEEIEVEAGGAGGAGSLNAVNDDAEILGADDGDRADAPADPGEPDSETPPADAGISRDAADPDAGVADDPTLDPELSADDEDDAPGAAADLGEEDDDAADDPSDVGLAESEPAAPAFDASDVAGALATAIREDEVDDDDLETLREELGGGVPNSTQAEIEHVQSRVSELEAYTDALEAFIDENGPAQDMLADMEADIESLQNDVADVHNDVAAVEERVDDTAEDVAAVDGRVDDVEEQLGAVDDLEDSLDRLRGDIDALDERLSDTEDDVLDLEGVEDDIDDLEDDLEDVEDHVDEIEEWRSQLSDVFGA
jgi:predicted nuclease with TOPRIM domain